MSAPLPEALRARLKKLVEEGLSGRAAALRLRISAAAGALEGHFCTPTRGAVLDAY